MPFFTEVSLSSNASGTAGQCMVPLLEFRYWRLADITRLSTRRPLWGTKRTSAEVSTRVR